VRALRGAFEKASKRVEPEAKWRATEPKLGSMSSINIKANYRLA
jgi:hypothetical protein